MLMSKDLDGILDWEI